MTYKGGNDEEVRWKRERREEAGGVRRPLEAEGFWPEDMAWGM